MDVNTILEYISQGRTDFILKLMRMPNWVDLLNKGQKKLQELSKQFDISARYLEALRAEINGYLQKPNRIKDFSCIDQTVIQNLEKVAKADYKEMHERIK